MMCFFSLLLLKARSNSLTCSCRSDVFSPASHLTVKIKVAQIKPPITRLKSASKIPRGRLFCSPLTASHRKKNMSLVFSWTVHLFRSFWNAACNTGCDQQVIEKPPPAETQVSVSTCNMKNPTQETPGKQFFTSGDSADGCSRLAQVSSSANFCFTAQKILQLSLRSSSSLTSISASPLQPIP